MTLVGKSVVASMSQHVWMGLETNVSNDDLPRGSRFLPKPYSAHEIVAALRDLTGPA